MWMMNGLAVLFLVINAYLDWKKQEISLLSIAVFGLLGIGINITKQTLSWGSVLGGCFLGLFVILMAFFTKETIGIGDGWILMVLGCLLGFGETLVVFLYGSVLCTVVMCVCLLVKKIQKNCRFPLVPFLLVVYLGRLLC